MLRIALGSSQSGVGMGLQWPCSKAQPCSLALGCPGGLCSSDSHLEGW